MHFTKLQNLFYALASFKILGLFCFHNLSSRLVKRQHLKQSVHFIYLNLKMSICIFVFFLSAALSQKFPLIH